MTWIGDVTTPCLVNFLQGNFGDEGFAADSYRRHRHVNVTMSAVGAFLTTIGGSLPRLTLNLGLRYDLTFPSKTQTI